MSSNKKEAKEREERRIKLLIELIWLLLIELFLLLIIWLLLWIIM